MIKYNLASNKKLSENINGMINGQALGTVSRMRYGFFPMSFNGCEVISVYNALCCLGKSVPLHEVAFFMERYKIFFGLFGCNVYSIGKALGHFGIECENSGKSDIFIMSFWTGKKFFSSVHTVLCIRKKGFIQVYNRYNRCPDVKKYNNINDISPRRRLIAVYGIKGG